MIIRDLIMEDPDIRTDYSVNRTDYSLNMSWMCSDPLFDSKHWYTDIPDFSVCLQKTLLIWLPCGFLWLCSPFIIINRLRSKQVHIPLTLLNTVSTILAAGLFTLATADLVTMSLRSDSSPVDIADPLLRAVTMILVSVIIQLNRLRGCRNSAVLWIFWTMMFIFSVPRVYSQLRREIDDQIRGDMQETTSYILTFVIIIIQWILAFFMDAKPAYTIGEGELEIFSCHLNIF